MQPSVKIVNELFVLYILLSLAKIFTGLKTCLWNTHTYMNNQSSRKTSGFDTLTIYMLSGPLKYIGYIRKKISQNLPIVPRVWKLFPESWQ